MQNTNFINRLKEIARPLARSLALPETEDPRVLQAASMLLESQAIDFIHLFGNPPEIFDLSDKHHISLRQFQSKIRWARADDQTLSQGTLQHCRKQAALRGKNIRPEDEVSILNSPLDKAAFLLADGQVDAVVAGCVASTAEVIRAVLRGVFSAKVPPY
ncbi:MAG: phosphate acyltransferase [Proteobacteria bacterium]|nr:phosphate acyltransferase [Pseudomonadota bacterium]